MQLKKPNTLHRTLNTQYLNQEQKHTVPYIGTAPGTNTHFLPPPPEKSEALPSKIDFLTKQSNTNS